MVPRLHVGEIKSFETIVGWTKEKSQYANCSREGVYIKVSDGESITHRFKMVREDFVQGALWNNNILIKNKLL